LYTGPAWLNPKLAELYLQPVAPLNSKRPGRFGDEQGANKKPRLDNGSEAEVEMPRDASVAPSVHGSDGHNRLSMGPDTNIDFGDMGGLEFETGGMDLSTGPLEGIPDDRLSTPGAHEMGIPGESYTDMVCKISMFDNNQSQAPESESSVDQSSAGFSKNTRRAIGFLRNELQEENSRIHFTDVAQKATRRAAASFFFELLVLGTKDCVKLEQTKAYSNIQISGKPKLWNQGASQAFSQSLL